MVDADRLEFRPDRLLKAVEQRARAVAGHQPTADRLRTAIERATICIDEIDKMSSILAGKPNALGVVLQQGLLTLMEGEVLAYPVHVWENGVEKQVTLDIDTRHMMFICGGAFEGLYDQVYDRVTKPGSGVKLKTKTLRTAEGQVRIETFFSLADQLKMRDLFQFGMVPQFMARFEKVVLLEDLSIEVLREILLKSFESPFVRARRFFQVMEIKLEIEDLAASLIAEQASKDSRTGARALRPLVTAIINPLEFDPWHHEALEELTDGEWKIQITADMVRAALKR